MVRFLAQAVLTLLALEWPAIHGLPAVPVAAVRPIPPPPAVIVDVQPFPTLAVGTAVALDATSGALLYQHGATAVYPLASLTKLMTALVVSDQQPDWSAVVTILAADQRPGGRVVLTPGEQVTVRDLLHLTLVASSNEAAVALARSTGMTEAAFVRQMNRRAAALGFDSLAFVDAAGLEPKNVGNARDVARLMEAALRSPELAAALRLKSYAFTVYNSGAKRLAESTNHLLNATETARWDIVGGKTGYLEEVGYNFVVAVQSQGHRVTFAMLAAPTADERWKKTLHLAKWVFASYRWPALGG